MNSTLRPWEMFVIAHIRMYCKCSPLRNAAKLPLRWTIDGHKDEHKVNETDGMHSLRN